MASEGIRVPPPLVPLGAIVAAWFLDRTPAALGDVPDPWPVGGWFLAGVGLALIIWAVVVQYKGGTDPNPFGKTEALVVGGPYGFSRNPIYVGDLFVQAGIALALGWLWGLVLLPVSAWVLWRFVIRKEEAFLAERFGETYDAYRARVRRWV